jgi:hypothetical protein
MNVGNGVVAVQFLFLEIYVSNFRYSIFAVQHGTIFGTCRTNLIMECSESLWTTFYINPHCHTLITHTLLHYWSLLHITTLWSCLPPSSHNMWRHWTFLKLRPDLNTSNMEKKTRNILKVWVDSWQGVTHGPWNVNLKNLIKLFIY